MAAAGVAYHHAGMLPVHKEIVERLFTSGLVRMLFATETFALGVNMPARTVGFSSLRKFDGERLDYMKCRDYGQMAGRAGRQGIDTHGLVVAMVDPANDRASGVRRVVIGCADPYGSAMWSWFTNRNTDTNDGDSFAEGIGQSRVTKNLEGLAVDRAWRIPDQDALTILYQLVREEGLFLGLSSGINVAGAVRLALERGPGQTIATILCDSGAKYQSKLFNPEWQAANGLRTDLSVDTLVTKL